jgi:signal transduction histidine kinase
MNTEKTSGQFSTNLTPTLLNFISDGVLILTAENRIEFMNNSAMKLLGCTTSFELYNKHISEIYACPNERFNSIQLPSNDEQGIRMEAVFRRRDGSVFNGLCTEVLVQEDYHDIKIFLLQDTPDQKKSPIPLECCNAKLERITKQLDEFTYIVSHDLKSPLRAISNLSVWIEEDLSGSLTEDVKKNLMLLRTRVTRMEALINGVHAFSSIFREASRTEFLHVAKLLADVISELMPPPNVSIMIGTDMPELQTSKSMLTQVFSHLLSNAIRHNDKEDIRIKIFAREKSDTWEFTIEDNGPGIASESLETIFAIFQTLKARDKFESTGIGLTIVKRILEDCGGTIHVISEIGTGSKFIFEWPKKAFCNNPGTCEKYE